MIHISSSRDLASSFVVLIVALGLLATGCASLSNTERGAAIGAGAGGAAGAAIGKATGDNTAEGAIIGAMIGGTAGAIIGQRMDRQAKELEEELENAEVERVGEGIKITFDNAILFDFDSSVLRPEAQANLRDLAASLQDFDDTEVLIVGHTDSRGSEDYNQRLSERRAGSAVEYLIERGLRPSRISTLGKGETEPVASNDTAEDRQQNRRVEVAIYASEEYREEVARRHGGSD